MSIDGKVLLWIGISLIYAGCTASGSPATLQPAVTASPGEDSPASEAARISAFEGGELLAANGARLEVSSGALDQSSAIFFENEASLQTGASASPMVPYGPSYRVDLGPATQTGIINLHVPLPPLPESEQPESSVFLAWAAPSVGVPNVVGVKNEDGWLTFPIQGGGRYQMMALPEPQALFAEAGSKDPVVVPPIKSAIPTWSAAAALTQLAQIHEGAWPAGGLEGRWGETSQWYLAGKAGDFWQHELVFAELLEAGGLERSYEFAGNEFGSGAQVIVWNWRAVPSNSTISQIKQPDYAQPLFEAFRAYLGWNALGVELAARPLAIRSTGDQGSLVLTGVEAEHILYNDPATGTSHNKMTWEMLSQKLLVGSEDERLFTETVVFQSSLRPQTARLGSLWMLPEGNGAPGAFRLERGSSGPTASIWTMDEIGTWPKGYYFSDLYGQLPPDGEVEHQLNVLTPDDHMVYGYSVANGSDRDLSFDVQVELFDERGKLPVELPGARVQLTGRAVDRSDTAGKILLADLAAGEHTLKFTLLLDSIIQDVKYIQFQLAVSPAFDREPNAVFKQNAFCRLGPDLAYDELTAFEAGTRLTILGFSPDRTWVKGKDAVFNAACWVSVGLVDLYEVDFSQVPILEPPPLDRPLPEDREPPMIEVSHSPSGPQSPDAFQLINFSAVASDNAQVQLIEIWVEGQLAIQCQRTTSCSFVGGPYPPGDLTYFARAFDGEDNFTTSDSITITIWSG